MATKKDLVEAYSFSRRRLVTAFVSGAPGGREVEPTRPGRTIVGGLALAVLLAAGAAIAGVFAPRTPDDWNQPGLIISKETGAAYVILESDEDVLRPVLNTTSAKLILGEGSEPTLIAQETIDDQRIGDDIGILGAPASVPTSSLLINSGWTACTGDGRGVRLTVAEDPDVVPAAGAGTVVRSGEDLFVVAQATPTTSAESTSAQPTSAESASAGSASTGDRSGDTYVYALPEQRSVDGPLTENLLEAIGLDTAAVDAAEVPREWLALFPTGAPLSLESLQLDGLGAAPAVAPPAEAGDAVVGDVLETEDGQRYLVTDDGPVRLGPFAAGVYVNLERPGREVVRTHQVSTPPPRARASGEFLEETRWPEGLLDELATEPCVQLSAAEGEAPAARLASPGESTAVGSLGAGERAQVVEPGRGALVLSGGWSGSSAGAAPYLLDAKGRAHPLVGPDAAAQLGYGDVAAPVVPDSWVELFSCGVDLSVAAALQAPSTTASESGSSCA